MSMDPGLTGVIEAALEIARKRRDTLALLRAALDEGRDADALKIARDLCGATDAQESNRTRARVN
jgi:hypothetical protein